MSDEPTERDVEALAASLRTMWFGHTCREVAQMLLDSGWFAEAIAEAEQRGREDNADHGLCYVSGSKALAARDAVARREGAAGALEALANRIAIATDTAAAIRAGTQRT